jgi:DNA-binding IclR family transcriptional regulator
VGKVRETGFAVDMEEFVAGLCCVSVSVRDGNGGNAAAISIAMPKMRFKKTLVPRWCEQLRGKSALISQQLGLAEA